jgi:hypothetical protein
MMMQNNRSSRTAIRGIEQYCIHARNVHAHAETYVFFQRTLAALQPQMEPALSETVGK